MYIRNTYIYNVIDFMCTFIMSIRMFINIILKFYMRN